MTRFTTSERTALCDLAGQVGEDQPTLCGGWTVKDLVVHLLVREGSLASIGIAVSPLAGLAERAYARQRRRPFAELVARLRSGPPRFSPFAIPRVDEVANTLELFVHHEDIRRARPTWSPRELDDETQRLLWSQLAGPGKMLTRQAPVGVTIEDAGTGSAKVLKEGTAAVTVKGPPSEVALYLFGRSDQARVELLGDDESVARLRETSLGM